MTLFSRAAALAAALLSLSACDVAQQAGTAEPAAPIVAPILTTADAVDPHSYARPREARVAHVDLDDIPLEQDWRTADADDVLAEFHYLRHSAGARDFVLDAPTSA